jgi:hypothetical protein
MKTYSYDGYTVTIENTNSPIVNVYPQGIKRDARPCIGLSMARSVAAAFLGVRVDALDYLAQ